MHPRRDAANGYAHATLSDNGGGRSVGCATNSQQPPATGEKSIPRRVLLVAPEIVPPMRYPVVAGERDVDEFGDEFVQSATLTTATQS